MFPEEFRKQVQAKKLQKGVYQKFRNTFKGKSGGGGSYSELFESIDQELDSLMENKKIIDNDIVMDDESRDNRQYEEVDEEMENYSDFDEEEQEEEI